MYNLLYNVNAIILYYIYTDMSLRDFIVIKKLGEGSFGVVQKVHRVESNQQYALKRVKYNDLKEKDKKNALNEIRILASINHPNVIEYKEAFFDENTKTLCTVMELAPNGDLAGRIKQKIKKNEYFYEYEVWAIGKGIVNGIAALHEKSILHRDIKPANIFFGEDGSAKIGDLNVALLMKDSLAYTQTGTPYYASPEVWANEPYAFECDVWSIGCVLYEMCCLRKPFEAKNVERLYERIKKLKYDPVPYRYSNDLASVISKCLAGKKNRITIQELKRIFNAHTAPQSCSGSTQPSSSQSLLQTIKVPLGKRDFNFCLPKAKYEAEPALKTETSIEKNPSILDYFMSPGKKLPLRHQLRSEKNLFARQFSGIQSPSFKQVLYINTPQKSCILNPVEPQQLKLRKKKIKITMGY